MYISKGLRISKPQNVLCVYNNGIRPKLSALDNFGRYIVRMPFNEQDLFNKYIIK